MRPIKSGESQRVLLQLAHSSLGRRCDATLSSINQFSNVCLHGFENARVHQCWSALR